VRQHLGGDSPALVGDRDRDEAALAPADDADDAPARCVVQCVGDQVHEHLADPQRVEVDERHVVHRLDFDLHVGLFGQAGECRDGVVRQDGDVGRLRVEREGPGFCQSKRSEILHELC
jgi:hypothetical protein